jgi:hypothetical protein
LCSHHLAKITSQPKDRERRKRDEREEEEEERDREEEKGIDLRKLTGLSVWVRSWM